MGWLAITKDGEILSEDKHGRPVQAGEEGKLLAIAQEDFGHTVCVDLINGVVFMEYETLKFENGTLEIHNPKLSFVICESTNIAGQLFHIESGPPDENGWYENKFEPVIWRPIWFTRMTNGDPTKVIGAQATLPVEYGGRNVKKLISLFSNGVVGID